MKFTSRLPEYLRSLARFPVPVAVSLALTLLVNLQISDLFVLHDQLETHVILGLVRAFLASLSVALWFSTRPHQPIASLAVGIVAAITAAILEFAHGNVFRQDVVVVGGLVLATMVAAHLRRGATIESFWLFDLQLGVAAVMGVATLVIVCGGLSLLLASCNYLFDLTIAGSVHEHIWATGAALIGPLFALGMIPANVDEPFIAGAKPDLLEKAVFYVLNFALAPLVLLYALILHAYAIKIAIAASMPKGEVGRLVLAFGVIGVASYMVAYPWRDVGLRPVRWLMRSWFWLMVIPTLLLTLAIWQRIDTYGVTPERYWLCLFAIWLSAMIVYFAVTRGKIDLRAIPASLAIGLILSSFGPWSSTTVSIRSQLGHLQSLLEGDHLLVNGRLKLDPPRIETFARVVASNDHVSSILRELEKLDALDRIRPMLASFEDSPVGPHARGYHLLNLLGVYGMKARSEELAGHSEPPNPIESNRSIGLKLDVGRYDMLIGPLQVSSPLYYHEKIGGLLVSVDNSVLTASDGLTAVSFNLTAALESLARTDKSPVLVPAHEGREHAMLILVRPYQIGDKDPNPKFEVWLLLNSDASKFATTPGHP
jgi:Domain of unknown function (DUF4153)